MACPGEADRAYAREFPDGPQLIDTFKLDDPEDIERLKKMFGAGGLIEKAAAKDAAEREELATRFPLSYIYGAIEPPKR